MRTKYDNLKTTVLGSLTYLRTLPPASSLEDKVLITLKVLISHLQN